jgi:hypothetical protein
MYNIEYDLKLDKNGFPYIEIPETSDDRIEHRFFNIAMSEYMISRSFELNKDSFDDKTAGEMINVLKWLSELKMSLGEIVLEQMEIMGDVEMMINKNFHFKANSLDELENLYNNFTYDGKMFNKKNGLIALVGDYKYVYTDDKWIEITKNIENETN